MTEFLNPTGRLDLWGAKIQVAARNMPICRRNRIFGTHKIEQSDIENLAAVAEKVRASGTECYLTFTTLRDSFSAEELERFRVYRDSVAEQWSQDVATLESWRRPGPILFTERELGKFDVYDAEERARLPHQHLLGLRELAANSTARYLDTEPHESAAAGQST